MTVKNYSQLGASEPYALIKIFTVIGFLLAITTISYIAAYAYVTFTEDAELEWPIFLIVWGLSAKFFQWSVHRGIQVNLATRTVDSEQRREVLGEQLFAIPLFTYIISFEIVASSIWLLFTLLS